MISNLYLELSGLPIHLVKKNIFWFSFVINLVLSFNKISTSRLIAGFIPISFLCKGIEHFCLLRILAFLPIKDKVPNEVLDFHFTLDSIMYWIDSKDLLYEVGVADQLAQLLWFLDRAPPTTFLIQLILCWVLEGPYVWYLGTRWVRIFFQGNGLQSFS